MTLEKLIWFDSAKKPVIPEKYRSQFPYLLTISNQFFSAFDYICCHIKTPGVEDFMAAAKFSKSEYVFFGESGAYGWTDDGYLCTFAVALKRPFKSDFKQTADTMWRTWLFKNRKQRLILENHYGSGMYIECGSEYDLERICKSGYGGQPIFDRCVLNVGDCDNGEKCYECYDHGKKAILDRQQMLEWLNKGKVANAYIGKKPLKNGELRIVVTPIYTSYSR